jgi:predicted aldo/keto reductase-like oxidoreductase
MARLDTSLKRLKMEHVDILYLHNVSSRETALHPFFLEALERAKKSGRTRLVGLSTHKNEPEVLSAAVESKFYEVVLVAYNFKQDHVLQVRDGIAKAAAAGLGIVGMKTFAGGWLDKERTMPVNTKAALKWVLKDPHVHTVIPGFTTFDQLEEDLAVMADPVLSTEEEKDLRLAAAAPGLYCQGCESCLAGCSRHLPLPELMRSYMYVYGYRNPGRAREVVGALGLPDDPCAGCAGCSARCARGFDLRARVRDIARLASVPEEFLA